MLGSLHNLEAGSNLTCHREGMHARASSLEGEKWNETLDDGGFFLTACGSAPHEHGPGDKARTIAIRMTRTAGRTATASRWGWASVW